MRTQAGHTGSYAPDRINEMVDYEAMHSNAQPHPRNWTDSGCVYEVRPDQLPADQANLRATWQLQQQMRQFTVLKSGTFHNHPRVVTAATRGASASTSLSSAMEGENRLPLTRHMIALFAGSHTARPQTARSETTAGGTDPDTTADHASALPKLNDGGAALSGGALSPFSSVSSLEDSAPMHARAAPPAAPTGPSPRLLAPRPRRMAQALYDSPFVHPSSDSPVAYAMPQAPPVPMPSPGHAQQPQPQLQQQHAFTHYQGVEPQHMPDVPPEDAMAPHPVQAAPQHGRRPLADPAGLQRPLHRVTTQQLLQSAASGNGHGFEHPTGYSCNLDGLADVNSGGGGGGGSGVRVNSVIAPSTSATDIACDAAVGGLTGWQPSYLPSAFEEARPSDAAPDAGAVAANGTAPPPAGHGAAEDPGASHLPAPVTVQVASRSRRHGDNVNARGRITRGAVGVFHPQLYLTGGDCIECGGEMMSRGRFERLAGTATAKWHVSIKVLPSGITLGRWLQQHGLPILQGRPRKRRADSDDCSLVDPEANDDNSSPLPPALQQPRRDSLPEMPQHTTWPQPQPQLQAQAPLEAPAAPWQFSGENPSGWASVPEPPLGLRNNSSSAAAGDILSSLVCPTAAYVRAGRAGSMPSCPAEAGPAEAEFGGYNGQQQQQQQQQQQRVTHLVRQPLDASGLMMADTWCKGGHAASVLDLTHHRHSADQHRFAPRAIGTGGEYDRQSAFAYSAVAAVSGSGAALISGDVSGGGLLSRGHTLSARDAAAARDGATGPHRGSWHGSFPRGDVRVVAAPCSQEDELGGGADGQDNHHRGSASGSACGSGSGAGLVLLDWGSSSGGKAASGGRAASWHGAAAPYGGKAGVTANPVGCGDAGGFTNDNGADWRHESSLGPVDTYAYTHQQHAVAPSREPWDPRRWIDAPGPGGALPQAAQDGQMQGRRQGAAPAPGTNAFELDLGTSPSLAMQGLSLSPSGRPTKRAATDAARSPHGLVRLAAAEPGRGTWGTAGPLPIPGRSGAPGVGPGRACAEDDTSVRAGGDGPHWRLRAPWEQDASAHGVPALAGGGREDPRAERQFAGWVDGTASAAGVAGPHGRPLAGGAARGSAAGHLQQQQQQAAEGASSQHGRASQLMQVQPEVWQQLLEQLHAR